jgi:predicted membrane protein
MKAKKKKTLIKKSIVIFIMFIILFFLVKTNYGVMKAYLSVSDISASQKQKKKLLEERKLYLEEVKESLSSGYGEEKELVNKFGVKKPGERVLVIIND